MRDGIRIVDADGHVQEPADVWERFMDKQYWEFRPRIDPERTDNNMVVLGRDVVRALIAEPGSDFRRMLVGEWNERFQKQFSNGFTPESYVGAMDLEGIDHMVLYPGRGLYAASIDEMDGGLSSAICRAYNRWLAEFCSYAPDRLIGVGLVALHDPVMAAAEARYSARTLGQHGIMIRPNPVFGRNLDDPAYDVFYAEVAALGVPLGVHEGSGVWMPEYGADRWPKSNFINHTLCHPFEQMAAVCAMTAGGVMERHPELQVGFLEAGGGWLPYLLDRLDEHFEMYGDIPSETAHLSMDPSEYFRRQGWISCEADERSLRLVADTVGADRMLWASDYPHPDAEFPGVVDKLFRAKGLEDGEFAQYAGAAAAAFYGLG